MTTKKEYVLKVKKTLNHIYATLEDSSKNVLATSSTLALKITPPNVQNSHKVGQDIGEKINKLNIKSVRFDRNGHKYHGRIKSLADGARTVGLEF